MSYKIKEYLQKLNYRTDLFIDSREKKILYLFKEIAEKEKINLNFDKKLSIENEITEIKNLIKNKKKIMTQAK